MTDAPAKLTATYSTWTAVVRDAPTLVQGLFVRTPLTLAQFAQVDVQIVLPGGDDVAVRGEVVSSAAIQWRPEARDAVEKLLAAAAAHSATSDGAAGADEPVVAPADDEDDAAGGGQFADRESLQAQIEAMSVNEKRQAALHGKKDMRWLLVRDQNKTIHPFVIKNPALTLDEVEQFARLTSINPEVLHTIAQNREWTRSANVLRNLVKNPKTPMPDALGLVDKLPISEVRALAKSAAVRTAIQMAARKKINS